MTDVIDHPEASIWKPAKHVVKPGRIRIFIRWFATLHTMDYRPGPISARVTLRDLAEGDYEVCLGDGPAVGTIRITGRSSGKSSNRLTGDRPGRSVRLVSLPRPPPCATRKSGRPAWTEGRTAGRGRAGSGEERGRVYTLDITGRRVHNVGVTLVLPLRDRTSTTETAVGPGDLTGWVADPRVRKVIEPWL